MDLVTLTQKDKKVSLLSLPRSDLNAASKKNSKPNDQNDGNQENDSPTTATTTATKFSGQLVLMQLPKGIEMSDLATGCHFVAPKAPTGGGVKDSNDPTYCGNMRQAALVVESKQQTFSISRLETSNSLVLVPPIENVEAVDIVYSNNDTSSSNDTRTSEGPASKKHKLGAGAFKSMVPVPVRLLKPGGSGASFLELRPKMLRPGELTKLLQAHVFDPYSTNNSSGSSDAAAIVGRTVISLAQELQSSRGQVEVALALLQFFPMPADDNEDTTAAVPTSTLYGVLSEEALQEAQNAIIATLAESDDFGDYAGKGVDVDAFVAQVVERFSGEQTYPELEYVVRYALTFLVPTEKKGPRADSVMTGTLPLDVQKIARCLAHRLFQSQKRFWEERLFCLRWQAEIPGVGSRYQTSLELLRGIAIPVFRSATPRKSINNSSPGNNAKEEADQLWRYLPADKLPFQPEDRLKALFAIREQWSLENLSPYMEALVMETGLSEAELLLQYTASTQSTAVGVDGKTFKLYSLKR